MFGGEDVPSGADLDGAVAAGSQHELLDTTVDVGVYMAARLAAMYARSTGTRLARYWRIARVGSGSPRSW
ncbi:MAG: hypothetical protein U0904_00060 [Candidatus Nanopelagicales bacterium]|nr:hypothetical protein [Candidatus Nanopelagicales bacterium]